METIESERKFLWNAHLVGSQHLIFPISSRLTALLSCHSQIVCTAGASSDPNLAELLGAPDRPQWSDTMSPPQSISPSQHYPRNIATLQKTKLSWCSGTVCIKHQQETNINENQWQIMANRCKWHMNGTRKCKEAELEVRRFHLGLVPLTNS